MRRTILATLAIAVSPFAFAANAEPEHRQLGAHVHGHGTLNVAIEGKKVTLELDAPGMDITGFEHKPSSKKEKAQGAEAEKKLKTGLELFALPAAAGCKLENAKVELERESGDHGHDEHDDHADEARGHHEQAHDDHKDDDHKDEDHAGHSAYNATYTLTCAEPSKITTIHFAYFKAFPGAKELTVNLVSENRQGSFEVSRDRPDLDLQEGM